MGLLDQFTGSASGDPEEQAAMRRGLLSTGLALLGSKGSFASALGGAGMEGMGAYDAARSRQTQDKQRAMQTQLQKMQLDEATRGATQRTNLEALRGQFAKPEGFDFGGYANAMAAHDPQGSLSMQASLRKEQPKLKSVDPMRGPGGEMVNVAVFEDGTTKVLPFGVKPEIALQSLGDQLVAIDKNATPGGTAFRMGASPDARLSADTSRSNNAASVGATMRGQNMTDSRSREKNAIDASAVGKVEWKQDTNGAWIALPKEVNSNQPVTPITTTTPGKKQIAARSAIDILNEAEPLLKTATGSFAGAGVDMAGRVVGYGTKGAQDTAKLKALEGALMMAQPRMEGPQSNLDVQLYRQMAGQIGDPTVPASIKQAAAKQVRRLQEKYATADGSGGSAKTINFGDLK